jgi:ATP-dependent Zn protease
MPESEPKRVLPYAEPSTPVRGLGRSIIGWVLFVGLAVMLFLFLQKDRGSRARITLSEFQRMLEQGQVAEAKIDHDAVYGTVRGITLTTSSGSATGLFYANGPKDANGNWLFIEWVLRNSNGAVVDVEPHRGALTDVIVPLIPWLLIFGFIWFFVLRQLRKSQPAQPVAYQVERPTGAT